MVMDSVWVGPLPSLLGHSYLPRSGKADEVVSKPNPNLPVLVYCRRDCGEITLEE
jgi:hypothetical protein